MNWLQQICDSAGFYSHITCEVKSLTMPSGEGFTLATDGRVLAAYPIVSENPDLPHPARENAIKMLTRREGQEVKFSDLYEWAQAALYHNCPYCAGSGKREALQFNPEDGMPEEVGQEALVGILYGQPINRRLLHLALNNLKAETVTIAVVKDAKQKTEKGDYWPIQIHCAEWILCVMPMILTGEELKDAPVFPAQLSCAP